MFKTNKTEQQFRRIEALCKKANITLNALSKAINKPSSCFYDVRSGRIAISGDVLSRVAEYFKVSLDYLAEGKENTNRSVSDEEIKIALFGGDATVTDEMWQEAKDYAKFILAREHRKGNNDNKQ